jgi:hypothetical protein
MNTPLPLAPLELWEKSHWSFFVNIQGLIISLLRFIAFMEAGDLESAATELTTATALMLASGAAMSLAGSFSRAEYESDVRQQMVPPNVQSDNFSGLMSYDHSYLMVIWKKLPAIFKHLSPALEVQHREFVMAYQELAHSHRAVCDKFGGGDATSLRSTKTAVDELDRFTKSRTQLLDPNKKCPVAH